MNIKIILYSAYNMQVKQLLTLHTFLNLFVHKRGKKKKKCSLEYYLRAIRTKYDDK
jgi:hypothetical protein